MLLCCEHPSRSVIFSWSRFWLLSSWAKVSLTPMSHFSFPAMFFSISPSRLATSSILPVAAQSCWIISVVSLSSCIFILFSLKLTLTFDSSFSYHLPHHFSQGAECSRWGLILRCVAIFTCASFARVAIVSGFWVGVTPRRGFPLFTFVPTLLSLSLSNLNRFRN